MITTYQTQAVWELCRQGYPTSADEAETRWNSGDTYHPETQMKISRVLRILIDQSNHEVMSNTVQHIH